MSKLILGMLIGIVITVTSAQVVTISLLSDDHLIVRSISPTVDTFDHLTPSWMAKAKFKIFGLNSCDIPKGDSYNPVVSYLMAIYGGTHVDEDFNDELVELAVKQGCSVNARDDAGLTPIHAAILFGQPRAVSLLIDLGADTNLEVDRVGSAIDGMNSLQFAHYMVENHKLEHSEKLVEILSQYSLNQGVSRSDEYAQKD